MLCVRARSSVSGSSAGLGVVVVVGIDFCEVTPEGYVSIVCECHKFHNWSKHIPWRSSSGM